MATDCGLPQRKKPKRAWPNSTRDGLLGRWNHPIRSITAGSMGGWFIVGLATARPISPNHPNQSRGADGGNNAHPLGISGMKVRYRARHPQANGPQATYRGVQNPSGWSPSSSPRHRQRASCDVYRNSQRVAAAQNHRPLAPTGKETVIPGRQWPDSTSPSP